MKLAVQQQAGGADLTRRNHCATPLCSDSAGDRCMERKGMPSTASGEATSGSRR